MESIIAIARTLGIEPKHVAPYGEYKAKVALPPADPGREQRQIGGLQRATLRNHSVASSEQSAGQGDAYKAGATCHQDPIYRTYHVAAILAK